MKIVLFFLFLELVTTNGKVPGHGHGHGHDFQEIEGVDIYRPRNQRIVVEGRSVNVKIGCSLDMDNVPAFYWEIQQKIYHTSNLPYIFKHNINGGLTLETVNRRMHGWAIQCVRVTSKGWSRGVRIELVVRYDRNAPDPGTSSSLEPSNLGRIILDIHIGVTKTLLSWVYNPDADSACAESQYFYKIDRYNRTGSGDIHHLNSTYSVTESITINSSLLYSQDNDTLIYFDVSALVIIEDSNITCATTEYLQTISGLEDHDYKVIFANGNSTSIEIPTEFIDPSLQLIWSTGHTQCVCPLVEELIDLCICNDNKNMLSLFNKTITISELEGMRYLTMNLANSTLLSPYNLRGIERVYIVYLKGSRPEALTSSYDRDNREICTIFNPTNEPKHPIRYRAKITGLTGDIWTSEEMNTTRCTPIPEEFYPDTLCSPFKITIYLNDSFGEEIQREKLELDLENIIVLIDPSSITTNSTNVTINCPNISTHNTIQLKLTLMQGEITVSQHTTHCNATVGLNDLQSGTNYTLFVNREFYGNISCELYQDIPFKTNLDQHQDKGPQFPPYAIALLVVGVIIIIVIIIITVIGIKFKYRQRQRQHNGPQD